MQVIIDMVADKYPELNELMFSTDAQMPAFSKLITIILYIRYKIGYIVKESEPFYNEMMNFQYKHIVESIEDGDIKKVLKYVIHTACCYIDEQDFMEEDDKQKTIQRLVEYAN
jgi:hypothetical protein